MVVVVVVMARLSRPHAAETAAAAAGGGPFRIYRAFTSLTSCSCSSGLPHHTFTSTIL
jgi:hypothetical protein